MKTAADVMAAVRREEIVEAWRDRRFERANTIRPERGKGRKQRPRHRRWSED